MPTNNDIEIKVVYVKIITSTPMQSTITMEFSPGREAAEDSLRVNGKAAAPVVLKRSRADAVTSESVYVSTSCIRFSGSCLFFEIGIILCGCSSLVAGLVGKKAGDGAWVMMQCKEGGGVEESRVGGGLVHVYFVGRSMGKAVVLNGAVELSKRWRGLEYCIIPGCGKSVVATDEYKELEKGVIDEQSCGGLRSYYSKNSEEDQGLGKDEVGELSWFSAGVRVGMGLGLAMSLGIGVGVSLIMRSYQAAAGAFKRLI